MEPIEVEDELFIFPGSVWVQTSGGWVSRPLTPEDKKRRQAVAAELHAAREVIRERLQQG